MGCRGAVWTVLRRLYRQFGDLRMSGLIRVRSRYDPILDVVTSGPLCVVPGFGDLCQGFVGGDGELDVAARESDRAVHRDRGVPPSAQWQLVHPVGAAVVLLRPQVLTAALCALGQFRLLHRVGRPGRRDRSRSSPMARRPTCRVARAALAQPTPALCVRVLGATGCQQGGSQSGFVKRLLQQREVFGKPDRHLRSCDRRRARHVRSLHGDRRRPEAVLPLTRCLDAVDDQHPPRHEQPTGPPP